MNDEKLINSIKESLKGDSVFLMRLSPEGELTSFKIGNEFNNIFKLVGALEIMKGGILQQTTQSCRTAEESK